MLMRIPWLVLGAGAVLIASLGCVDPHFMVHGDPGDSISEAVGEFSSDLRWGRLDRAAKRVLPDRRADFLMLFKRNDSFRFADVEVDLVDYDPEKEEALASVRFTLYRPPSVHEVVLVDSQRWHYDRGKARWLIDPDLDLFERAGR